jgi:hypothetical protein
MPKNTKTSHKSKKLEKTIREVSKKTALSLQETKTVTRIQENIQLFHNQGSITGPFLKTISQGVQDPTRGTSGLARIGNEILLQNLNIKMWVSNKLDRPNVMYRAMLLWNRSESTFTAPDTLNWTNSGSLPNSMILNQNTERFTFVRGQDRHLFSKENYAQPYQTQPFPVIAGPGILGREHSQLLTLNYTPKGGKKITYEDQTGIVKMKDLYVVLFAYDAFGTLLTDNIASYAINYKMTFKDA